MDLLPGMFVGDYLLVEPAGAGGFSVVWKARRPETGEPFALKFPRIPEYVDHLRGEASAAARIDDPQVVEPVEVLLDRDPPHLVLPWVEGKSFEPPEGRPEPVRQVVLLAAFLDVVRVVARLHEAGVAHGDLKPANIRLAADGTVRLLDLGLARANVATRLARTLSQSLVSVDGKEIAGTLEYMAPELYEGEPAGPATDVYALGVLLHHLLTGRPPAFGVSPSALNPYLPPGFEDVLRIALQRDPARRFSSAREIEPWVERMIRSERRCLARPHGHERRRVFRARMRTLARGLKGLAVAAVLPLGAIAGAKTESFGLLPKDLWFLAALPIGALGLILGVTTINAWLLRIPEKTYKERKGHPFWSFMMQ